MKKKSKTRTMEILNSKIDRINTLKENKILKKKMISLLVITDQIANAVSARTESAIL